MRKIKIVNWKAKDKDGKELTENLLNVLNFLLLGVSPEKTPKGVEKFRIYSRIGEAFKEADKTKELILEEDEYSFLKKIMEEDVPAVWGTNENISKAINSFLDAKEV